MSLRLLLIVLLGVPLLTGCGRKGSLEEPGSTEPSPLDSGLLLDTPSPGAQDPAGTAPAPAAPDRPFFLDPLL